VIAPADLGFRMPAEWTRHERCWMAWPCRATLWQGGEDRAKAGFAAVARAIAAHERVTMLARPQDLAEAAAACGSAIDMLAMPLDDSWMRDIGPTFLVDAEGEVAGADWRFNAWGGKFPPWDQDAALAGRLLEHLGVRRLEAPFVLEGGSIHVDGEGTLLTTEQCLLNPNRNPGLSRLEIEENLRRWLGVRTIVWLGEGLENDHTDGHVDDIACFIRPGMIVAATCADPADANRAILEDNLRRLRRARDAHGRPFEIIELPLPARRDGVDGRLALTYVNFYLANGALIAPSFDDPMDAVAARILAEACPDRRLAQIPALDILEGGGGIHCITQQQPWGRYSGAR
jgi:agmatine deiminase